MLGGTGRLEGPGGADGGTRDVPDSVFVPEDVYTWFLVDGSSGTGKGGRSRATRPPREGRGPHARRGNRLLWSPDPSSGTGPQKWHRGPTVAQGPSSGTGRGASPRPDRRGGNGRRGPKEVPRRLGPPPPTPSTSPWTHFHPSLRFGPTGAGSGAQRPGPFGTSNTLGTRGGRHPLLRPAPDSTSVVEETS